MIYVFNKNKILSYIIASSFVLMLLSFHENMLPNKDVKLVKVSSNVINITNDINSVANIENNY